MNHLAYKFSGVDNTLDKEILVALLNEEGYSGFIESGRELTAYLPELQKDESRIASILQQVSQGRKLIEFSCTLVEEKNWNETWESNFHPVEVDNTVRIRASFHEKSETFEHDIIIS